MSLLDEGMELFRYIDKTTAPDGYGSVAVVWHEGAEFMAATADMSPQEVMAADQIGVRANFKIITKKDITLMYGTVVQRQSDGKYFQVKSDGTDKKTPKSAGLNMRIVKAEALRALPDA